METDIDVEAASVGAATRRWDEQHLELRAAAAQIGDAPLGFAPGVAAAAERFRTAWQAHARMLGEESEVLADGLRAAMREYVASDEAAVLRSLHLLSFLEEQR